MKRLDILAFEKKLFPTREKAKEAITQGTVCVDGKVCTKAGEKVDENATITLNQEPLQYVSRAGLKLEAACKNFYISLKDLVICDVGASTGGFTDYAIQNGAKKVYAIDVGTGQLHQKLKNDSRVINLEKTDFRTFEPPEHIDVIVCDCSFISLRLLFPNFKKILQNDGKLITLIKPQFEVGKELAQKFKGVIKDEQAQKNAVESIIHFFTPDFNLIGLIPSPILGTAGNREFLAFFKKNTEVE